MHWVAKYRQRTRSGTGTLSCDPPFILAVCIIRSSPRLVYILIVTPGETSRRPFVRPWLHSHDTRKGGGVGRLQHTNDDELHINAKDREITYSSTPVFRGFGSRRSARVRLFSTFSSDCSSSVRSVTGEEASVTEVVIPKSLGSRLIWADSCGLVLRLRDSTRVQGPSASRADGLRRFVGRGTGVDDSGAVADDSDWASTGMERFPPPTMPVVPPAAAAFLAFFFLAFGLVVAVVAPTLDSAAESNPPGTETTAGMDTTFGVGSVAAAAGAGVPAGLSAA